MYKMKVKRLLHAAIAVVVGGVALIPALSQPAYAYNTPTARSIGMTTSVPLTAATYHIQWTAGSNTAIKSIVVDFCTSPLIITTCTAPTTWVPGAGTTANLSASLTGGGASWASAIQNGRTLTLTNSGTASAMTANTTVVNFDYTTPTNPVLGSFYARILTYANQTGADAATGVGSYTATATPIIGNAVDAGGIALTTANQITITAKVQEKLNFCIFTGAIATHYSNCTQTGSSVTLGDTNGVLDTTGPYVDVNTKFNITTNAQGNAVVAVKGTTLTNSQAQTIAAIGATAAASSAGNEQFGFCEYVDPSSATTANVTIAAPYNNASCNTVTQTAGTGATGGAGTAQFAFDSTNINSTYGQTIFTKQAGDYTTTNIAFIGNISNTTKAGVYTTALTFIATGTY